MTEGTTERRGGMATNPRYKNGSLRRKNRARMKALGEPCHICGKPIHYDEPSDAKHPLSFVIDEVIPVSRWKEFGYESPQQVAQDWNNLAPAHYACNAMKGAKLMTDNRVRRVQMVNTSDGQW